jgi:hypothetical protein
MKRSDINLLDSHLADKNLTWVAQDLIAMDNADRVCQLLGADTRYIQEGLDLFRRFAREIDPAFARQARELAEAWKNEGDAPAYIYTEAQNHGSSLRFPELPAHDDDDLMEQWREANRAGDGQSFGDPDDLTCEIDIYDSAEIEGARVLCGAGEGYLVHWLDDYYLVCDAHGWWACRVTP